MNNNIFTEIEKYYHNKTFEKEWNLICGNGNKKLDEIQIFLQYLKNKQEKIDSIDSFNANFVYSEKDVAEPGDLMYKNQIYQITHGNNYFYNNFKQFSKKKNSFIIPATDLFNPKLLWFGYNAENKEFSSDYKIILLIRIDRRKSIDYLFSIKDYFKGYDTGWKKIILIFNDVNLEIFKK